MNWDEFFFYSDGNLYWKQRPRNHFKTERSWKCVNSRQAGKLAGNLHSSPRSATNYRQTEVFGKGYKVHRIVWEIHNGAIPEDMYVDHIDGNGLNNAIENLRLVDPVSSMHNLPTSKSNTSGVIGVCWHNAVNAWQARISWDGERIDLGRYESFDDAVKARKLAEKTFGYHDNHGRPCREA